MRGTAWRLQSIKVRRLPSRTLRPRYGNVVWFPQCRGYEGSRPWAGTRKHEQSGRFRNPGKGPARCKPFTLIFTVTHPEDEHAVAPDADDGDDAEAEGQTPDGAEAVRVRVLLVNGLDVADAEQDEEHRHVREVADALSVEWRLQRQSYAHPLGSQGQGWDEGKAMVG